MFIHPLENSQVQRRFFVGVQATTFIMLGRDAVSKSVCRVEEEKVCGVGPGTLGRHDDKRGNEDSG